MKTNLYPQKLSNLLIDFPNLGGISNIKFWRKPFFVLFLFFISVATVFPQSWTQLGSNIEGQEYSLLGYSVSMSADGYTIIAGGTGLDQNEEDSGYAKVLIWNGTSWIQKGSDLYGEAFEDQFGYSVSISSDGNTIAVGAIQDDDDQLRLGYAKVFTWNGTSWILKGNKISGENAYDRFGTSISLSSDGNIVAVNSRNGTNGEEAGNVKVFTWNGSVWEQKGSDLEGDEGDGFGWSISLSSDGNTLAVGAANGNELHGYARLYNWSDTEWVQKGNDLVGDAEWDRFGFSVSMSDDGNTVAIGASQNSGNGERSGQLKVFNWNGSDWDFSSDPYLTAEWTDSTRQFTQEFRLTSPVYELFDYVAGVYYLYQNIDKNATVTAGPEFPVPDAEVFCKGIVIRNSIAGYINANLHLLQNLSLNAGLRYTYEKSTAEFNSKNYPEPIFYIDVEDYSDTYSEGVLSPRLGLNYSLSANVFMYGFVAQGFTSGGWNLYFASTMERIKYEPEYATSFELGIKSSWWNNRVIMNLSTFLTKFRDYQVSQHFETEEGFWDVQRTNAGKATTKGFEFELSILLLKELKIGGGWGYADARFDEYKDAGGEGIDYDGNRLPWAPKNEYNISVEYQQAVGNLGSILLYGEFVHQGNYYCMASNDVELSFVDSHELLNARVGFNFADNLFGIFIWGRNLLDELYLLDNSPAGSDPSVWYGPPRMYGIDVYYNFLR